ncbi:MAG: universal stress protein [Acidobacteriota bacterium]
MSHVTHKLSGPLEGALAGGGDPATSPLYVFGPYLRLLAASGVASLVFGSAIWLAVLTVVMVSAMYRLVMRWVTDGSGGSGLAEEEFGKWAVMVNAAITIIEYSLTFLVSVAALVTFLADRLPGLNASLLGLPLRTVVAIACTLVICLAVNRGPRVSARAFGPATAAVLLLLWTMIVATVIKSGLHLPALHWAAFSGANLNVTLGGYARILALMTGIEIFANLVAAYEGTAAERSNKAFGSLIIVMGTTCLTMLIVGPEIQALADPQNHEVSVFTQTMDRLLPAPLPYIGSLIGIAVLLSAAAASAQGIQNLSLGLRYRQYIPAWLGERNRHGVAANPVWLQGVLCTVCFLVFGTLEETYLSLYAAGVFILLSLTGWAAVKRLLRETRAAPGAGRIAAVVGIALAATLTSGATVVIFEERLREGAWMYAVLVPALYLVMHRFRRRLGAPRPVEERLGQVLAASSLSPAFSAALYAGVSYRRILVPLDRSPLAELSLAQAQTLARHYSGRITLLTVLPDGAALSEDSGLDAKQYLEDVKDDLSAAGYASELRLRVGGAAEEIGREAVSGAVDLVILSTQGRSLVHRWVVSDVTTDVIHQTTPPLLIIRPTDDWRSTRTRFQRLLVPLDGSEVSEEVLPHVHEIASTFGGEVLLMNAPEGSESDDYAHTIRNYLDRVAAGLAQKGIAARVLVVPLPPAQGILHTARDSRCDLVMMVTHGRGGVERQATVKLGSVAESVLQETICPLFLVSPGAEVHAKPVMDPETARLANRTRGL